MRPAKKRTGKLVGGILIIACLILAFLGAALVITSNGMPAHIDEVRATELTDLYQSKYVTRSLEERAAAERDIAALRTSKWQRYNTGLSLCVIASVLLVAILRFRLWNILNLQDATTPSTRVGFLTLASVAWLALLPATLLQLEADYTQDDLTPTFDTGHGSFIIFGTQLILIGWLLILVIGRFILLRNKRLPANLWHWDPSRPRHRWLLGIFGLLTALLLIAAIWSAQNMPWTFPSLAVAIYLALSTRAALSTHT
ncbi:hypothetical protein [Bradyrhizobium sp. OAE829]|uniref:hypothetical protein n=1 Tax=Bradyrhizobium sp. OAE829 TaxID=2663807 RepID=UPI00178C131F